MLLILWLTGTTLNVMSLMGVVMMVGIVVSNSILIVEFTNRLVEEGRRCARRFAGLPRALAPGVDDISRHVDRPAADGAEARRGQRSLRAAGHGDHRRPGDVSSVDCFHCPGGLPAGSWEIKN